MRFKLAIV